MKVSNRWKKIAEIYKKFAKDYPFLDFSADAELEMYLHESIGSAISNNNGYYVGKRNMDIAITSWKEDIKQGHIFARELLTDYPKWFLQTTGVWDTKPTYENCKWWLYK